MSAVAVRSRGVEPLTSLVTIHPQSALYLSFKIVEFTAKRTYRNNCCAWQTRLVYGSYTNSCLMNILRLRRKKPPQIVVLKYGF